MAARPRKEGNKSLSVSFWLRPLMIEELDKYAVDYKLNRSRLIKNLISLGIEEMKIVDSIKIVKLSFMLKDVKEQWKIAAERAEEDKEDDVNRPHTVSLSIDESLLRDIDKYADKLNLTRNNFIERLIVTGMHDVNIMKKLGIMEFAKVARSIQETWKKLFYETQKSLKTGQITLKDENNKDKDSKKH